MKRLSKEELQKAPVIIQQMHHMALANLPMMMAHSRYMSLVADYPEYFPDVIERRRKWAAIPDEVHAEYKKKSEELREALEHLRPNYTMGMHEWLDEDGDAFLQHKTYSEAHKNQRDERIALHRSTYSPYGIETETENPYF